LDRADPTHLTADEAKPRTPAADDTSAVAAEGVHRRIGELTRRLHDALRELGYHDTLCEVRDHLPDARDRLSYIARVTGEAADKVLNAVDAARTVQEDLVQRAQQLSRRWDTVAAFAARDARSTPAGRTLVEETCAFFDAVDRSAKRSNEILTDIMMAQNFHDLTGQVVAKVVRLAATLEEQLLKLLLETSPQQQLRKADRHGHGQPSLAGPVVNAEGRSDVVTNQQQVDDLLASLGF
jgi:chemotaxis protein CheZ